MILKIITDFHRDNERNITTGLKELSHKDLDYRLTMAGYNLKTDRVIKLTKTIKKL